MKKVFVDLGKLDSTRFSELPVVLYQDAGERDRLVMMGLHHISGKRRWPAINRARAMEQLLPHFHNDADAGLSSTRRKQTRVQPVGENAGASEEPTRRATTATNCSPISTTCFARF